MKSLSSKDTYPWEGITWVLDLLPHFPGQCLQVLDAYLSAHVSWMPDGRISGIIDASDLIRAKFIDEPKETHEKLDALVMIAPHQFECLVERLYNAIGYETELTPFRSDGGRDVIAKHTAPTKKETLLIECKRYTRPVNVKLVRSLLGVVTSEKAIKGVLVSTSTFTRGARDFANKNAQLELIEGVKFVELMNEHLGAKWPLHIERLVVASLKTIAEGSLTN